MSITIEAKNQIAIFLEAGDKIGAIQYLKETYNFSLQESSILVEALEQEMDENRLGSKKFYTNIIPDEQVKTRVATLLKNGEKLTAIKFLKGELNIALKESRRIVEIIENEVHPDMRRRKGVIFSYIFPLVGIICVGLASLVYYSQSRSIGKSDLISGKVIMLQSDHGSGSAPLIEYEWNGKVRTYQSSTYSSPPAYTVDEVVPVYVNRDDPDSIIVDTFMDRWFAITILVVIGSLFIGISVLVTNFVRK